MRRLKRVAAGIAIATAAAVAATAAPALADPPTGSNGKEIVPQSYDVVGVGANTDENLFNQLSADYNKTIPASKHNANHPYFYSFNATAPGSTSTAPTNIVPKAGCKSSTGKGIVRPNGSTAGWEALDDNTFDGATGHYCLDFARSSSGRNPLAPKAGPGGVIYVGLAKDALTWASRVAAHGGSDAPASLTKAQLVGIFTCKTTNWKQVGGKPGAIKVYLPQTGSGTLSSWEKFMGITTLGSCVNLSLEENQGESKQFNDPTAIFIYSIADWIAQKYHSRACNVAKPATGQNAFGCDVTGFLALGKIGGVSPVTTAKVPVINPKFPSGFFRTLYDVVRWTAVTKDHIYKRLEPFFSSKAMHGFLCSSPIATKDIVDYGFIPSATCGSIS
jgi:ABC-type phosphate transport system substrate-binding protein